MSNNAFTEMYQNMMNIMGNMQNMNQFNNIMNNWLNLCGMNNRQNFDASIFNNIHKKIMDSGSEMNQNLTSSTQAVAKHCNDMMQNNISMMMNLAKEASNGNINENTIQKQMKNMNKMLQENVEGVTEMAEMVSRTVVETMETVGKMLVTCYAPEMAVKKKAVS